MIKNKKKLRSIIKVFFIICCILLMTACIQEIDNGCNQPDKHESVIQSPDFCTDINTLLGNPSHLVETGLEVSNHYLVQRNAYSLSYNNELHIPNWVSWHLSSEDLGDEGRLKSFFTDPDLPDEWEKVGQSDFRFNDTGFERGHMCPHADRDANVMIRDETYVMTNIIPQCRANNAGAWADLENTIRNDWIDNKHEAYIISGPIGIGGESNRGKLNYIVTVSEDDNNDPSDDEISIAVPSKTWKAVIILEKGDNDLDRISSGAIVTSTAVIMPNDLTCSSSYTDYIVSIDEIEKETGLDLFSEIADVIEDELEAIVRALGD